MQGEWNLIHTGDLGQLKVVSLPKIDNIRVKFQNLILISCWKFGGKFCSSPHAQTFSLREVKAPLGVPEKSSIFFSYAIFYLLLVSSWSKQRSQVDAAPESGSSLPVPPPATLKVSLMLPPVLAPEEAFLPVAPTIR